METTIDAAVVPAPLGGVGLFLRLRWQLLRNTVSLEARQRPLRVAGTIASVALIWGGLYYLLRETFRIVNRPALEGIVATPLIFTFFFLALSAMLAFSNAILSYGGLFRRPESSYLMVSPVSPLSLVLMRYLESLVLASWSLVLLGLPLMLAIAQVRDEPWSFYPLFLGLFLLFIPIPGAVGLLLAWSVAMVAPKTPRRLLITAGTALVIVGTWWVWDIVKTPISSSDWLRHFYDRISLVQNAMLPHTWVSKGISHAMQGRTGAAVFYLFVTAANALFFSVIAVAIVARGLSTAFARAQVSSRRAQRSGRYLTTAGEVLFAYLPWRQRLLAIKDLKSFARDPLQWSQMAILIGLLALYISNVQRMWTDLAETGLQVLIAYLNLTAVSLILATFTSRFVFPIVSLEGQQLWLLGLLPLNRSQMVLAKFLFALTITLAAAIGVMGISVYRLELPGALALAHLIATVAICLGLCGVSIGVGARMPVFHERNPARIAGGFGGTVGLLLSVALVVASLVGMGMMSLEVARSGLGDTFSWTMALWLGIVLAVNIIAGTVALSVGIRHFNRLEY